MITLYRITERYHRSNYAPGSPTFSDASGASRWLKQRLGAVPELRMWEVRAEEFDADTIAFAFTKNTEDHAILKATKAELASALDALKAIESMAAIAQEPA